VSALRHLYAKLPEPECIRTARLATIGPRTGAEAEALGLQIHPQALQPDAASLVSAIVQAEATA